MDTSFAAYTEPDITGTVRTRTGRMTFSPGAELIAEVLLTESLNDHKSFTLASELASVDVVEQNAEALALRAGFDESTASSVAMVCREAAVNAVIHGNGYSPQKNVRADFSLSEGKLTVKVADQGTGMNPDAIPDPSAPENLLRTSGRGVFLMRAIMDEVHFRQLDPGTEVTLIKYTGTREAGV